MICPKCGGKDFEFFNEPEEEKVTYFTPLSIAVLVLGVIVAVVGFIILIAAQNDRAFSIGGYILLGGFALAVLALLSGARPHFAKIYHVKGLCKSCGFQFILEQANIPKITPKTRGVPKKPNMEEPKREGNIDSSEKN